ncbi:MAG: helix-turn-helix transcriptional regulator [Acidimicrobiales bacterium]
MVTRAGTSGGAAGAGAAPRTRTAPLGGNDELATRRPANGRRLAGDGGPRPGELGGGLDAEEFSAMVAAVTSAFGDPTRREIYLFARSGPGVTATEVAARFELHPNVARHHLDKLAAGGYLEVVGGHADQGRPGREDIPAAGAQGAGAQGAGAQGAGASGAERRGAGRPSKCYRTPDGHASGQVLAFPPRRDDLLVMLLGRALELLDPTRAECLAETVGEEYGTSLAAHLTPATGQRSIRSALQTVAEALTAHGFAAHAEPHGTSMAVVADHCPFGDAGVVHPIMCAVDRGMVRGMLAGLSGTPIPVTMSSRARGDETCAAVV